MRHLEDLAREVLLEEGALSARELASELANRGHAFAVMSPEAVEITEESGEEVVTIRGGMRRALSPPALESRLRKGRNGFKKRSGKWYAMPEDEVAGAVLRGDA